MPEFEKQWKRLGFSDLDLKDLEAFLCENPDSGDLIQGSGGLRKLRWAIPGHKGKSGGSRVLYVDFASFEKIYMITCFTKNMQVNLTDVQIKAIKSLIDQIKEELRGRT